MARVADKKRRSGPGEAERPEMRAIAVLGFALGVFWLLALLTHDGARAGGGFSSGVAGLVPGLPADVCGPAGNRLATFTAAWVGGFIAPFLPLVVMLGGLRLWGVRATPVRAFFVVALVSIGIVPILLHVADGGRAVLAPPGGEYGARVGQLVLDVFGRVGAWIVLVGALLASSLWFGGNRVEVGLATLERLLRPVRHPAGDATGRIMGAFARVRSAFLMPSRADDEAAADADDVPIPAIVEEPVPDPRPTISRAVSSLRIRSETAEREPVVIERDEIDAPTEPTSSDPEAERPRKSVLPRPRKPRPAAAREPSPRTVPTAKKVVRRDKDVRKKPAGHYAPPPLSLLRTPPKTRPSVSREELLELSETLGRTLEEFGIRGRVGEVHPGPVITRYDFEPAPGVKVNQVVSRVDDIALALRSDRIRILTRIPGKAAVGIEIPNDRPDLIHFRDIVTSRAFREAPGALKLALGKDTAGRPYVHNLEAMPHLLVAGSTGSGKSVGLNTMIVSLLLQHRPEDLRFIMIDPKMLELTGYDDIPHLALPVVTESKEAAKALNWLVLEMERRYRLLAGKGVRNITSYREKFFPDGTPITVPADEEPPEPMPYFVCIVDELADLMMTCANDVETPIARLAQMARAVGIHLILATQRPSVDVITGLIKANFPARIAFQVASRTDSRTVLDQNGAENLIGRGDMLFLPPGRPAPIRVHGAFLTDEDIETLAAHLRRFASGIDPIEIEEKANGPGSDGGDFDELFGEAARMVALQGQASTSFLQRRLKIGYSRAGRLMDQLETAGIVSAFEGSKAREVLMDIDELEEQGIL